MLYDSYVDQEVEFPDTLLVEAKSTPEYWRHHLIGGLVVVIVILAPVTYLFFRISTTAGVISLAISLAVALLVQHRIKNPPTRNNWAKLYGDRIEVCVDGKMSMAWLSTITSIESYGELNELLLRTSNDTTVFVPLMEGFDELKVKLLEVTGQKCKHEWL